MGVWPWDSWHCEEAQSLGIFWRVVESPNCRFSLSSLCLVSHRLTVYWHCRACFKQHSVLLHTHTHTAVFVGLLSLRPAVCHCDCGERERERETRCIVSLYVCMRVREIGLTLCMCVWFPIFPVLSRSESILRSPIQTDHSLTRSLAREVENKTSINLPSHYSVLCHSWLRHRGSLRGKRYRRTLVGCVFIAFHQIECNRE